MFTYLSDLNLTVDYSGKCGGVWHTWFFGTELAVRLLGAEPRLDAVCLFGDFTSESTASSAASSGSGSSDWAASSSGGTGFLASPAWKM